MTGDVLYTLQEGLRGFTTRQLLNLLARPNARRMTLERFYPGRNFDDNADGDLVDAVSSEIELRIHRPGTGRNL